MLCFVKIIEDFVKFLTTQAYIYAALYGGSLMNSGKMAYESFKTKGFERYFNLNVVQSLLGTLTGVFALFVAVLTFTGVFFLVPTSFYYTENDSNVEFIRIFFALNACFVIFTSILIPTFILNSMLGGMSNCQIALYLEDPGRLGNNHSQFSKFVQLLEKK